MIALRDVFLRSLGYGGAASAAGSREDPGSWKDPKAASGARGAVPAADRGSEGLGDGGEAPDPRRRVPLLRWWTSLPGGGIPGISRRPLPAPKQSQE